MICSERQCLAAMIIWYIVAGCVLLCLCSAQDVVYDDDTQSVEGHSRDEYPNPTDWNDYHKCRRKNERSYICDPDQIVSELEGYPFTVIQLSVYFLMFLPQVIKQFVDSGC